MTSLEKKRKRKFARPHVTPETGWRLPFLPATTSERENPSGERESRIGSKGSQRRRRRRVRDVGTVEKVGVRDGSRRRRSFVRSKNAGAERRASHQIDRHGRVVAVRARVVADGRLALVVRSGEIGEEFAKRIGRRLAARRRRDDRFPFGEVDLSWKETLSVDAPFRCRRREGDDEKEKKTHRREEIRRRGPRGRKTTPSPCSANMKLSASELTLLKIPPPLR